MKLCACGCGKEIGNRKNKKFASAACRYRFRDGLRYQRQKEATVLAIKILTDQGFECTKKAGPRPATRDELNTGARADLNG